MAATRPGCAGCAVAPVLAGGGALERRLGRRVGSCQGLMCFVRWSRSYVALRSRLIYWAARPGPGVRQEWPVRSVCHDVIAARFFRPICAAAQ